MVDNASPPIPGSTANPVGQGENSNPNSGGPDGLLHKHDEIKRGVKPGSKRGPYKKRNPDGSTPDANPQPSVVPVRNEVYNEENTKRIFRTIFNIVAVKRDMASWRLSDKEEGELAASFVPVFNQLMPLDPKYSVAAIALLSLGGILSEKIIVDFAVTQVRNAEPLPNQPARDSASKAENQPKANPPQNGKAGPAGFDAMGLPIGVVATPPM